MHNNISPKRDLQIRTISFLIERLIYFFSKGIELGNYLIKRVVQELQTEFPMVNKFSTLSPIPGFHTWLTDKLKAVERGENEILTAEEEVKLQNILSEQLWSRELRRHLKSNQWLDNIELATFLQKPLMRLCARYLFLEKRRSAALDSVGKHPSHSHHR